VQWRDPYLNRPAQTLIGIQSDSEVLNDQNAAYMVTHSSHWIYTNSGFKEGDSVPGIVGYEADKQQPGYPLPSSNPSTHTLLSNSPFTTKYGVADTASSSIYQARSGAWVFASGTMSWSWGLANYDVTLANPHIQQTTATLLDTFRNGGTPPPNNLVATAASASQINLSWTNNAGNATGITVQRSPDGSNWTTLTSSLPATAATYADTGLAAGTYFYRVLATNAAGGTSDPSNTARSTTLGAPTPTVMPTATPGPLSGNGLNRSTIVEPRDVTATGAACDSRPSTGMVFCNNLDGQATGAVATGSGPNQWAGVGGSSKISVEHAVYGSSPNALAATIRDDHVPLGSWHTITLNETIGAHRTGSLSLQVDGLTAAGGTGLDLGASGVTYVAAGNQYNSNPAVAAGTLYVDHVSATARAVQSGQIPWHPHKGVQLSAGLSANRSPVHEQPLPLPRVGLGAATGADGRVYTVGGEGVTGTPSTVEAYDPSKNTWACSTDDASSGCSTRSLAPLPTPRHGFVVVAGADGRIYVIGGEDVRGTLSTVEAYDPSKNTWACSSDDASAGCATHSVAPLPTPRQWLAAALGSDGRLYVVGGYTPSRGYLATVEAYVPATNTWSTVALMPTPRGFLAAARGGDGRIYAIGGYNGRQALRTVEAYTAGSNTWATVAPLPTARDFAAAATGPGGQIYLLGGNDLTTGAYFNTVLVYNPSNNHWVTHPVPLSRARWDLAAAAHPNGLIYTVGGIGDCLVDVACPTNHTSGAAPSNSTASGATHPTSSPAHAAHGRISASLAPATMSGAATAPGSFTFGAMGDFGASSDTNAVLSQMAGSGLNFMQDLGDASYNEKTPESAWCSYIQSYLGSTFPFEVVSGNHESDGMQGLIDNFAACLPNRMGNLTGTYGKEYYYDYPASNPLARIIMISPGLTFINGGTYDYSVGSPHYKWTASAIDGARAAGIPWVIVGMHKVCLSTGSSTCSEGIGNDINNLLISKKVDLVLQGHDHSYQRSKQPHVP
jgi:hypothetical protein